MTPPDWTTLRIFLAAIERGSVTRASEKCGIAVSAAAKRIQDMEAELGIRLLDRTGSSVRDGSSLLLRGDTRRRNACQISQSTHAAKKRLSTTAGRLSN